MESFAVWYADASLVVVDKPAGLLAVPGRGEAGRDNLAARVCAEFADARVVHRLDMATSGLMLFARGESAQRVLNAAFARRQVAKRYVAIVEGELAAERGEIDAPLAADWPNRPRQKVDAVAGKPALTRWSVLARGPGWTRLRLEPVSGRSHQLRVHLGHLGHPVRGDALYGEAGQSPRLLLHAERLEFAHPGRGERVGFRSAPPF